ncbi:hypothetical protein GCM10008903_27170 [Clostridium cadaveris]
MEIKHFLKHIIIYTSYEYCIIKMFEMQIKRLKYIFRHKIAKGIDKKREYGKL